MVQFGDCLIELRRCKKMTQSQLAKKLFVTAGTISNYENNVRLPDVEKLNALASLFDVSADYLLGRTGSKISVGVFGEYIYPDIYVGSFVEDFIALSIDRKQALILIMHDMKAEMKRFGSYCSD